MARPDGFSLGRDALDVVPTTPARHSVVKTRHDAPLKRLATNAGEKYGPGPKDAYLIGKPAVSQVIVYCRTMRATGVAIAGGVESSNRHQNSCPGSLM